MTFLQMGGLEIVIKFAVINQSCLLILSRICLNMASDGGKYYHADFRLADKLFGV